MAIKNRDEVSALIQAQAAVVGETEYKTNLDTDMTKNIVFRKDVSDTDTATAATKTLDFLDIDYIEVTQSVATCAYTLNNIQQGEIKFLKITKTANQEITFAVGTDVSIRKNYITTLTSVIYKITNKDGNLFIESISVDNELETSQVLIEIGDWDMDADIIKAVTHGISNYKKIRGIKVIIREDSDVNYYSLTESIGATGLAAGGIGTITSTLINLTRITGGVFDGVSFDSTSYNRGWVLVDLAP